MKIGLFLVSLAAIALIIVFSLWEAKTVLLIGRFHSLLIHFPIAFLLLVGLLEAYSSLFGNRTHRDTVRLILSLSFAGSLVASLSGYLLSLEGGFSQNTLYWHLRLGLLVTSGTIALLLLEWARSRWRSNRAALLYQVVLSVAILALVTTGHLGGKMAHGPNYLTEYLPRELKRFFDSGRDQDQGMLNPETATLFDDLVHPILDHNCVECHGPTRNKGDLRLDTREGIEKGGESGPVVVPGSPDSSELIRRTLLPLNHNELMPPEGNVPLGFGDIEILRWWISEGAPLDRSVQGYIDSKEDLPFSVSAYLDRHFVPKKRSETGVFAVQVPPAAPEIIEKARKKGFRVQPIADEVALLSVQLSKSATFSIDHGHQLDQLAPQIAWLDLSGVAFEEKTFQILSHLPHLERLNVSETNVGDEDLSSLAELKFLEYLNLYGTDVSDTGVQQLAKLDSLRKLFLWETASTAQGIDALQRSLPNCTISRGDRLLLE